MKIHTYEMWKAVRTLHDIQFRLLLADINNKVDEEIKQEDPVVFKDKTLNVGQKNLSVLLHSINSAGPIYTKRTVFSIHLATIEISEKPIQDYQRASLKMVMANDIINDCIGKGFIHEENISGETSVCIKRPEGSSFRTVSGLITELFFKDYAPMYYAIGGLLGGTLLTEFVIPLISN